MQLIETLRQFKIWKFAVVDFVVSFFGFWLLWKYVPFIKSRLTLSQVMYAVIPISVIVHLLTGQMTPLTTMIIHPVKLVDYIAIGICIFMLFSIFYPQY